MEKCKCILRYVATFMIVVLVHHLYTEHEFDFSAVLYSLIVVLCFLFDFAISSIEGRIDHETDDLIQKLVGSLEVSDATHVDNK